MEEKEGFTFLSNIFKLGSTYQQIQNGDEIYNMLYMVGMTVKWKKSSYLLFSYYFNPLSFNIELLLVANYKEFYF